MNGLFYDGEDLRHLVRWGRHIPIEVQIALELVSPPEFDGVKCVRCGRRFKTEFDHVQPHGAKTDPGPTSLTNLEPECCACHRDKSESDRKKGKFRSGEP